MVYYIIRFAVKVWLHLHFRIQIEGLSNIPNSGCILAMNHRSNYDSLLVGVHTPRKMYIMAKEELFQKKFYAWAITEMGAYPVKRDRADVRSIKHTLKLVEQGKIFSIFIEGTRSKSEEMHSPKKGIGFLIVKSKAPVVPVFIQGASGGWFAKVVIRFGKPILFVGDEYEEIATRTAAAIQSLAVANPMGEKS